jgi:hypothetical protein
MFYLGVVLVVTGLTEGPSTVTALLGAGILTWEFEDRIFGKED